MFLEDLEPIIQEALPPPLNQITFQEPHQLARTPRCGG